MESVRNLYLHGKVCRVATGSNLSGFFSVIVLLELNKLAFERMLQEELFFFFFIYLLQVRHISNYNKNDNLQLTQELNYSI